MRRKPPPVAPNAPVDAPAYDPVVPAAGEDDVTWAELNDIASAPSSYTETPSDSSKRSARAASAGAGCTIDTGIVYTGSGYPYGTVGGTPRTTCDTIMVHMTQSTTLYKTVWWGLQEVAGPFTNSNSGEGTIQQTNVQVVCADLRDTTFRMIVRNTGTFPTGSTGTATAYEEANLQCGTNP